MNTEPDLPVTPTNEGRRPRISNFGYNVPYADLWPMLVGIGASMLVGMIFATGAIRVHWAVAVVLTLVPSALSHTYVKLFVEDAHPHAQQDAIAKIVSLEPDFSRPLFSWFPLIPSFRPALSMAADPQADDGVHPLMRLREEYSKQSSKR